MEKEIKLNNLLKEYFELEKQTKCSANILNITEEWFKNTNKTVEILTKNITGCTNLFTNSSEENVKTKIPFLNLEEINDFECVQYFRMKKSTIFDLQHEINCTIDNFLDQNLLITLFFLGSVKSLNELSVILKQSEKEILESCEEYFTKIETLSSKYIYWPNYIEMLTIEKGFLSDYKFPGVVGVIGSLYIKVFIDIPENKAKKYFNTNLGAHCIVLQVVCDNNNLFRDLYVRHCGSENISTVLKTSSLYKMLTDENGLLTKNNKHLLGGSQYPPMPTLLTPYCKLKNINLSDRELKFNRLHENVIKTIEKTFESVENRFPRIKQLNEVNPIFATLSIKAICILHNFCNLKHDSLINLL